jgi:type I site-specific restriction-modification system R (restriction) subunit
MKSPKARKTHRKEKLKTKWAALEALVGDPKARRFNSPRSGEHFEKRLEAMEGKAMVVCMSRRICVDLYNAIIALASRLGECERMMMRNRVWAKLRGEGRDDRLRR